METYSFGAWLGGWRRAVTLSGYVERQGARQSYQFEPPLRAAADQALSTARAELDRIDFEAAWAAGQAMSLDEILTLGLESQAGRVLTASLAARFEPENQSPNPSQAQLPSE